MITAGEARCLVALSSTNLSPATRDPRFVCTGATAADAGKHTGGGSLGMQKPLLHGFVLYLFQR